VHAVISKGEVEVVVSSYLRDRQIVVE